MADVNQGRMIWGRSYFFLSFARITPKRIRMSEEFKDLNHQYYDRYFQYPGRSQWMERIWSEAFGDQYPAGLEHYGYLTQRDLQHLSSRLQIPSGSTLLDIGCGKGGPGLKLAETLELRLIGVDLVPGAVAQARLFQQQFDLAHPARFEVGEFYNLPLEDDSVDAVVSIDSLWVVPNKITALKEAKRVMKPGGKFLFTQWDLLEEDVVPLLEQSGLTFVWREESPNWKDYQMAVYEGIVEHQKALIAEMGESASALIYEVMTAPQMMDLSVRRLYHFELR